MVETFIFQNIKEELRTFGQKQNGDSCFDYLTKKMYLIRLKGTDRQYMQFCFNISLGFI